MSTHNRRSIKHKLLSVVLIPIIILVAMIIILGMTLLYRSYIQTIQDELTSTTNILIDCLNLTVRGDYSYENDLLLKGDLNITDSTMLYRIKENSQIDTTIFWKDTRILSTVENQYGVSAVGTKASPEVIETVLNKGEAYYSTNLNINGVEYIGYYRPLENSDHSIVGMVFAGKSQRLVSNMILRVILWFLLFSAIAVAVAILLIKTFSKKMISDINIINKFLRTISEGNLTATLDTKIIERGDELSAIGKYASKMRSDLKKMIEMDPLTSLYNRRSCNNRLNAPEMQNNNYSVVMCDIDWFKKVNDNYGHDAGDYILVMVSQIIKDNIKDVGFASRWGGEEFLLIYMLGFDETKKKIEELQKNISEFDFVYDGNNISITMTFGIDSDTQTGPCEERIKNADHKLYKGKNNGRNQIVY